MNKIRRRITAHVLGELSVEDQVALEQLNQSTVTPAT